MLPRRRDHGVGLLDRHRQRLLADDVLARLEGRDRLGMVEKRRRGDVDQVDVVAGQELVDLLDVGDAEPPRGGVGGLPVRARHAGQLHARHLGELLEGIEPETPAADHAQSDLALIHDHSVPAGPHPSTSRSRRLIGVMTAVSSH